MATDEEKEQKRARRRLRRADATLTDKMTKDIAIAYKPIEEWDWEELSRGRPRNKKGTFIGPKPGPLTPAIEDERRRRITQLTMTEIAAQARDALKTIHELMTDKGVDDEGRPTTPAKVRLDAATYYLDQFIGKARTSVEFSASEPFMPLNRANTARRRPFGLVSEGPTDARISARNA